MQAILGTKKSQSQKFLENGMRIPVTLIDIKDNWVISHKTTDKDHYQAVQLGFNMKKKASRAELGHAKGAKLDKAPKFLREVRVLADGELLPEVGSILNPMEIFAPGDMVDVSGFSKGKGFAGVVKRHGFHGGPKTHGQSDRHRAPGSIGQGTTPGRVYRGKRMAGRMGSDNVTIQNLQVVDVSPDTLTLKGLVPGILNALVVIKKVGEDKKFVPLWKEQVEEDVVVSSPATEAARAVEEKAETSSEEVKIEESAAEENKEEVKTEAASEVSEQPKAEEVSAEETKEEVKEEVAEDAK